MHQRLLTEHCLYILLNNLNGNLTLQNYVVKKSIYKVETKIFRLVIKVRKKKDF